MLTSAWVTWPVHANDTAWSPISNNCEWRCCYWLRPSIRAHGGRTGSSCRLPPRHERKNVWRDDGWSSLVAAWLAGRRGRLAFLAGPGVVLNVRRPRDAVVIALVVVIPIVAAVLVVQAVITRFGAWS